MMKSQLINIILISITLFKYVTSVDIECDFKSDDFDVITDQYTCEVQNILMIKSKNVVIQTFRGSHNFGKTSSDVTGLTINDKKIQFMPKNLDERFKNLVAIKIRQGRLKEISRDDLKGFKKLKYLNLDSNDIATLDDDIFEFNPQLEIIWFEGNRIKNIGMSVFDNLKNLNDLDLNGNACISKRMSNNRGMAEFLKEVKKNCFDAALELDKLKQKYMNVNAKNLGALNSSEVEAAKTVNANKLNAQKLTDCNNFEVEELKIVVRNVTDLMKNKEKDAEEKLTKLNSKVKEKDEKLKKFEEKLANLTTLQTQVTNQLETCQTNLNATANQTSTELAIKTNRIMILETQLTNLQVNYSQLLEKHENLTIENQNLTEALNSTELKPKAIDIDSLPDELSKKIEEYKNLDNQLKQKESELKQFEMEVAKTISNLTKSKETIENILKHKNQEIVRKDAEIKRLKSANAQFQNINKQLQDQLKDVKTKTEAGFEGTDKCDNMIVQELNETKKLLELEKVKLQELEVKLNATLKNRTNECVNQQELQVSNRIQEGLESSNEIVKEEDHSCAEQLRAINSSLILNNNKIKSLEADNQQLQTEKRSLLAMQSDLKDKIDNKTSELSKEVEKSKEFENIIIHNEAVISGLLVEKSQLKDEIKVLTDSEQRFKNTKNDSCSINIEKLHQDLKNCSNIERNLRKNIADYENVITNKLSTIENLNNEINHLKMQLLDDVEATIDPKIKNDLKSCIVEELRKKNLQIKDLNDANLVKKLNL